MKLRYPSVQKHVPSLQNYVQTNSPSVAPKCIAITLQQLV